MALDRRKVRLRHEAGCWGTSGTPWGAMLLLAGGWPGRRVAGWASARVGESERGRGEGAGAGDGVWRVAGTTGEDGRVRRVMGGRRKLWVEGRHVGEQTRHSPVVTAAHCKRARPAAAPRAQMRTTLAVAHIHTAVRRPRPCGRAFAGPETTSKSSRTRLTRHKPVVVCLGARPGCVAPFVPCHDLAPTYPLTAVTQEARDAWRQALRSCGARTDARLILELEASLRDSGRVGVLR